MSAHYSISDLLEVMARLRDPERGCPWDLQQDFASIAPHTLEECYELVDAIERGDFPQIRDELGDVLFQVIFYAQLGREQGRFDFGDIVHNIVEKLLRRHPHVFPNGKWCETNEEWGEGSSGLGADARPDIAVEQVGVNWERIKQEERASKNQTGILDDVPVALPALSRAVKLQKRAARVGFDWDSWRDVFVKMEEEKRELEAAIDTGDIDQITDEMGDLLFVCVNLARFLKVDPETALRTSNRKFERRFGYIERTLAA
ncbi:MAG TPA: nucleoside triphosphate pyrophosphohydrolase, partial [Spongiibacteraceae bacterium]|nr:nucleoside triphosphate pyrophosphohydrolase [Spongiibacteraceae bacterium]